MKKFNKFLVFSVLAILFGVMPVQAADITLDDVVSKVKSSELYDYLNSDDGSITLDIKVVDNSIIAEYDANIEDELISYTTELKTIDNVLTYTYSGPKTSTSEFDVVFFDALITMQIFISIAELNGYTQEQVEMITEEVVEGYTLSENGIELKYFTITEESNENDVHVSGSITGIDSFKVDINNLKLDLTGLEKIVIPSVEFGEISFNSIDLNISTNVEEDKKCNIYRSIDGINYSLLESINCNSKATYTDTTVSENSTYYYKVSLDDSSNYSTVVYTTTKKNVPTTVENPKTGVSFPVLAVGGIILVCLISIISLTTKNAFRKI